MAIYRTAVRHDYPLSGGPGYNIFHFRTTLDQGPQSSILTAAGDALEAFYTALIACFPESSNLVWTGEWSQVDGETFLPPLPGWTVNGGASGDNAYLPPATALCITWRSSEASQSGRGRTFLSPLQSGTQDTAGTPTTSVLEAVRGAAAGLVESFAGPEPGDEGSFGVYSRTDGVLRDFVGATVPNEFAVLRSRRD